MRTLGFGRALFGLSLAGLAILSLVYGNFAPIFAAFPATLPWREVWAYGLGAILLAASAGLFFPRTALASVVVVAVYEVVWVVARARPVFVQPRVVASWYGLGEALVPLLGAWMLYALLRRPSNSPAVPIGTCDRSRLIARILFGACCLAFGAAHFAYAAYTAPMVPAWMPGHLTLVYLTGAAHAAAGLGLILGVLPRLAATLEALMLTLFGVLVWLPVFFAQPMPAWASPAQVRWSETFLGFLLAGAAWILAASLGSVRGGTRCP